MSAMILKVKKKKNAQIRPELMSSLKLINIFDALKCFTSKRKEYIYICILNVWKAVTVTQTLSLSDVNLTIFNKEIRFIF